MTSVSINKSTIYIFILIVLEILSVSLAFDGSLIKEGSFTWLLLLMSFSLRWLFVFTAIFILILFLRFKNDSKSIYLPRLKAFSPTNLTLHLIIFALFISTSFVVYNPVGGTNGIWQFIWFSLSFLVLITWLNLLTNLKEFSTLLFAYKIDLFIVAILAIVVILLSYYARDLWQPLSYFTLSGADWLLSLFFNNIYLDVPQKLLGVNDFIVEISPQCSGLEGLVIALTITFIYLYLLRDNLKFPLVFLLFPVAAILAITFNIIRVALLISIGALYSPEIAVSGFHSVAGWLTAVLVSFLIVFVFTSMNVFNKKSIESLIPPKTDINQEKPCDDSQLAWAILVPFILFLVVSLTSNIFFKDFNYLYPLKVIVGLLALIYFWKFYLWQSPKKWFEPILAGLIVAILWVNLVPADAEYDLFFIESIKAMPLWLMLSWCFFRLIGFWFIAPILEELVFRGYLIARLTGQPLLNVNKLKFSLLALVVSSIVFGFIHNNIVAGTVAGIVFAVIRYRHNSLAEPIVSHMSANIFVAIWAIITGQWVLL